MAQPDSLTAMALPRLIAAIPERRRSDGRAGDADGVVERLIVRLKSGVVEREIVGDAIVLVGLAAFVITEPRRSDDCRTVDTAASLAVFGLIDTTEHVGEMASLLARVVGGLQF